MIVPMNDTNTIFNCNYIVA